MLSSVAESQIRQARDTVTTELIVGIVSFATAVIGLVTAYISRMRHVIHRHEQPKSQEPERSHTGRPFEIELEMFNTQSAPSVPIDHNQPSKTLRTRTVKEGTSDGLNSSTLPSNRGASGGKNLPPRTHAIHKILFDSLLPLSLSEIESQLLAWKYEEGTVSVTRNHLRSLCKGWGKDKIVAVIQDLQGRYELTPEGRARLAEGPFSEDLA